VCPLAFDPNQGDADSNGLGDACNSDEDTDGDDWADVLDNCPSTPNGSQRDADSDGVGDACNDANDLDGDEWADALDNCPQDANPRQGNRDADPLGDACDLCPDFTSLVNSDTDGNGIGDMCECGDQTADARVDVIDLVAINAAIFDPSRVTVLCDTNDDQLCNVEDMLGVNAKIFGAEAYCSRYPKPAVVSDTLVGTIQLDLSIDWDGDQVAQEESESGVIVAPVSGIRDRDTLTIFDAVLSGPSTVELAPLVTRTAPFDVTVTVDQGGSPLIQTVENIVLEAEAVFCAPDLSNCPGVGFDPLSLAWELGTAIINPDNGHGNHRRIPSREGEQVGLLTLRVFVDGQLAEVDQNQEPIVFTLAPVWRCEGLLPDDDCSMPVPWLRFWLLADVDAQRVIRQLFDEPFQSEFDGLDLTTLEGSYLPPIQP
jgi:hypothetical protein